MPATATCLCPLCGHASPEWELKRAGDLLTPVVDLLRRARPRWEERKGACLCCTQEAVSLLLAGEERSLFYGEDPAWDHGRYRALPLHARLGADRSSSGRGVTVAFLDSGFYPHRELVEPSNRILVHVDAGKERFVEHRLGRRATWPVPPKAPTTSWHGSMTSTFALGNGLRSDGVYRGLASEASAVLVKVTGQGGRIGDRQIAAGLRWVLANHERYGIRVVNVSCGGDHVISTLKSPVNRLVRKLFRAGVLVVAAAGNTPKRGLVPPASAPEALTVGGVDDRNSRDPGHWRLWHSTFGPTPDGIPKPDLLAPSDRLAAPILPATPEAFRAQCLESLGSASGREALARLGLEAGVCDRLLAREGLLDRALTRKRRSLRLVDGFHQRVDGTSFAAPIVAAAAAQLLEVDPSLPPKGLRSVLKKTALPLESAPPERQGGGVVRPGAALAYTRRRMRWRSRGPSPRPDREHFVFHLLAPNAKSVEVVGEWSRWRRGEALREVVPGVWRGEVQRPPSGRWGYLFRVDGTRLLKDPENPREEPDGYGGSRSWLRS